MQKLEDVTHPNQGLGMCTSLMKRLGDGLGLDENKCNIYLIHLMKRGLRRVRYLIIN